MVSPFACLTLKIELIVEQGCKDFHRIDRDSDYPLEAAEDNPAMCGNSILGTCVALIFPPQGLPYFSLYCGPCWLRRRSGYVKLRCLDGSKSPDPSVSFQRLFPLPSSLVSYRLPSHLCPLLINPILSDDRF